MKRLLIASVLALAGCMTTGGVPLTPNQQAITSATVSYQALDTAILSADSAVKAGVLKGSDARNAVKGLADAKAGLDVALASLKAAQTGLTK